MCPSRTMKRILVMVPACLLLLFGACNDDNISVFNQLWQNDDVEVFEYYRGDQVFYFMRQRTNNIQMEALINGKVSIQDGCTVLVGPYETATVIWPEEFRLEEANQLYRIRGKDIIIESGDSLRLSGGFYSQVPDSYCTGSFWLVGSEIEVLE